MRREHRFFVKCMLYSLLSGHPLMLTQIISSMAVPIMNIYNKTSVQYLDIHDEGAFLSSVSAAISCSTLLISMIFLIPIMDSKGRKFVCVHLKCFLSLLTSGFYLAGYFFQSSVCIMIASCLSTLNDPTKILADPLYFAEICQQEGQGYFTFGVNIISTVVSGSIMMAISKPTVFGNDQLWYFAPIIAIMMTVLFYLVGLQFEETLSEEERKDHAIVKDIANRVSLFKELIANSYYKKVFVLVFVVWQIPMWSSYMIEMIYTIQLYAREGMTTDQTLNMNLLIFIIFVPLHWIGPTLNEKISRRNFIRLCSLLILLKNVLHIINIHAHSITLAYVNSILHSTLASIGISLIGIVICADNLPTKYRVVVGQVAFLGNQPVQNLIAVGYPLLADYADYLIVSLCAMSVVILVVTEVMETRIHSMKETVKHEKSPLLYRQY